MKAHCITVVVPLYNKERDICRTIASILNQSVLPDEVIVVDDGSTDNGVDAIRSTFDSSLIKIIEKKNGGVSSARNCGVKMASCDYIAFLDGDDEYGVRFIETMLELIETYPGCGLYASAYELIKGDSRTYVGVPVDGVYDYFSSGRYGQIIWSSCVIVKRSSFDRVGLFDTTLKHGEDLDMWMRVAMVEKCAFTSRVCSAYNLDASNRAMSIRCDFNSDIASRVGSYKDAAEKMRAYARRVQFMSWHKYMQAGDFRTARKCIVFIRPICIILTMLPAWVYFSLMNCKRISRECLVKLKSFV